MMKQECPPEVSTAWYDPPRPAFHSSWPGYTGEYGHLSTSWSQASTGWQQPYYNNAYPECTYPYQWGTNYYPLPPVQDHCNQYPQMTQPEPVVIAPGPSIGQQTAKSSRPATQRRLESGRPPYSLIALTNMAIQNSPTNSATLKEIYAFIEDRFPYFRGNTKYRGSVRHTLTVNDCFIKRPKQAGQKGCPWAVDPTFSDMFSTGSLLRRAYRYKPGSTKWRQMQKAKTVAPSGKAEPLSPGGAVPMPRCPALPIQATYDSREDIDVESLNASLNVTDFDGYDPLSPLSVGEDSGLGSYLLPSDCSISP